MKERLLNYANYLQSDDANTDPFMYDGIHFADVIATMDEVALAIRMYVKEKYNLTDLPLSIRLRNRDN